MFFNVQNKRKPGAREDPTPNIMRRKTSYVRGPIMVVVEKSNEADTYAALRWGVKGRSEGLQTVIILL